MSQPLYSPLVARAFELAARWHVGQVRKNPVEQIPYIAHPALVGFLLQRAGYDDETIAAGILHDVLEDCDVTTEELTTSMTPRVTELVAAVTEQPQEVEWEERKAAYRKALESAPVEAVAIAAADHLCNIRDIVESTKSNVDVWAMFFAKKAQRLVHEEAVLRIVESRMEGQLVEELRDAISLLRQLPD